MKVDGGCHCGNLSYEAEIDSDRISVCHCTDCQALSGSAYRVTAHSVPGAFKMLSGEPSIYIKIGTSGAKRPQAFCPNCGAQIYSTSLGDEPKVYNIRIGTIRQRAQLLPTVQIWSRSALPWLDNLSDVPKFEEGAP